MAFLLSACTRKEEVRPVGDGNNTYTITASFADGQAKASVGADGSCSWTAGDKIAVFDAVSGSFCEFETETGNGVFSFTGTPGTSYQFTHAYYPASIARDAMTVALPEAYTASQVQTASAFPAAGTVEGNTIQFRHLAALLRYSVKGIPATATSLELSSSTVSLSGAFPVEGSSLNDGWVSADGEGVTDHGDIAVKSGESYSEIHARAGASPVNISLVPGELENLTFYLPIPVGAYTCTLKIKEGNEVLYENTTSTLKDIYRAHLVSVSPYKPGFSGGTGTAAVPYLIGSTADLLALSGTTDPDYLSAHYLQTCDIDLGGADFTPCGTASLPFSGVYEGSGHVVSNYKVQLTGDNAGLFGVLSGTVKDLTIRSADIYASDDNAGAIAGLMAGGSITACRVDATTSVVAGGRAAGSVVGRVNDGTLSRCAAHGNVTAYDCAGGIAGFLDVKAGKEVLAVNCVYDPVYEAGKLARATLETANTSAYMGGISGAAYVASGGHTTIANCYAYPLEMRSTQPAGTTGVWFAGGILGRITQGPADVFNCISPVTYSNFIIGGTRINDKTKSSYTAMACIVGHVNSDGCSIRRTYSKKSWPYSFRVASGKTVTTSDLSFKMGDSNMRGYHNVVYSASHPVSGVSRYTEAEGGILAALNAGVAEWNAATPATTAVNWAYDPMLGYPKPVDVDEAGPVTKKVSIIGDSISTYEGYIFSTDESGMGKFYPDTGNYAKFGDAMVLNEQDTWWWQIIYDAMSNARLEVCNAWGGTTTSYFTSSITNQYGTAEAYIRSGENSIQKRNLTHGLGHPDVLFYYGGRNDYALVGGNTNVLLGSYTTASLQAAYDAPAGSLFNNYAQGSVALLKDFHTKNPGAKIVVLLHDMMNDDFEDAAAAVTTFLQGKGYDIRFVNFHMRGTTNKTNTEIGMSKENGTHPDKTGCANMASYIVSQLGSWLEE